jgi:hypothetical protein
VDPQVRLAPPSALASSLEEASAEAELAPQYTRKKGPEMPYTEVLNLATGATYEYSLPPKNAVECAYAQYEQGDYNTWEYAGKYNAQLTTNGRCWYLGDFSALISS